MRALDGEEREVMAIAVMPSNTACRHCGADITDDVRPFPEHLKPAAYRLAKRGLVRFTACPPQWAIHFDATTTGRVVYRIATGAEVA